MSAHSANNFTGSRSILSEPAYGNARRLGDDNKNMIEDYRGDVGYMRGGLHKLKQNVDDSKGMYRKIREEIDKDPNNMSYGNHLQPAFLLGRALDLSQLLNPGASE
ncbi:hypothetical protein [Neisseria iguanae]|uniref:Uncharacterized protein n=1 Tax=Neisseria iguanae TaxID=90242 RepID=A0A2P7TZ71_9NEIS|nr:hypothetical protein [Neisseria iguanae]PSJ79991.1 hypothetical protein C7N83_08860 [Neisseria iguanae]